jgi:hypothetical protein
MVQKLSHFDIGNFTKQDSVSFDQSLWASTNGTINWANFPQQIPYSEADVFHTELSHTAGFSSDVNWTVRIGKGGQLYYIDFENFGQIICPQRSFSAWNDDCMTTTVYSAGMANTDPEMGGNDSYSNGYVHGSGMYVKPQMDYLNNKPFYCPVVGENFDTLNRSYSMINLGLIPKPSINRPDVLFYSRYRDIGFGIIEISFYCYNFGQNNYNFAETPWFAVRPSKFPNIVEGINGTKSFKINNKTFQSGAINKSGGWGAHTVDPEDSNSMSCGLVWGSSGSEQMAVNFGFVDKSVRDMSLIAPSVNTINMGPGTGIRYRRYVVLGKLSVVADFCSKLNSLAFFEKIEFSSTFSGKLPIFRNTIDGQDILTDIPYGVPVAYTFPSPVKNSVPLFLMKNKETNQYFLSTDPFAICNKLPFTNPYPEDHPKYSLYQNRTIYQVYDNKTEWVRMLGYVLPVDNSIPFPSGYIRLSEVLTNITYIEGEKLIPYELMVFPA